ncbi:MAG: hypothetical protein LCH47_08970 [Proteobacteria bacterium]|nr:hypothetical protein [Pseudomonadota bacterium]
MNKFAIAAVLASAFSATSAFALEPIKGSITFDSQPSQHLSAAPVNSPVSHEFVDEFGKRVSETYIVTPDRNLKLVDRSISND